MTIGGQVAMSGFSFVCPVEIRFVDVDAMDHVNNATVVTYLEVARTRLWEERFGAVASARDFPFIVARVAVDYRSPIHFGDQLRVGIRSGRIGATSFTFHYRLEASGRLAVEAETVQVMYDYASGRPARISEAVRERLQKL